jgi:prepilin-type N-terminal cleavage/methylation domain-containing protein
MKITPNLFQGQAARKGFTLAESITAMAVFVLVSAGVIFGHLTGLKMYQVLKSKMGADEDARSVLSSVAAEIGACYDFDIGTGSSNTFTAIPQGTAQQGNAIQIWLVTNGAAPWVRYYQDSTTNRLFRMYYNGTNTSRKVVAEYITNTVVFSSEDFRGVMLTNQSLDSVVSIKLTFSQLQYPNVKIGTNKLYDWYQLRTKISRRIHI